MGSIISAECSCGYCTSAQIDNTGRLITAGYDGMGDLLMGNGMRTRGIYYYPALCDQCKEVVPVNLDRSPVRCPVCKGSGVVPYYKQQMAREKGNREIPYSTVCEENEHGQEIVHALYEDTDYLCPECGANRLRFKHEGLWD